MTRRRRVERPGALPLVLAGLAVSLVAVPLLGLVLAAPWSSAWSELTEPAALSALRLSLLTSSAATALALVLGLPLAWVQARVAYPGKRAVRAFALLPMVLPPVVGGAALLLALGRRGIVGRQLGALGVQLPFSTAGAVLAEAFVAMPFLVLTMEAAFAGVDRGLEDVARTLGASRSRTFRTVTLPLVAPSLAAGTVVCWARALGEFGATLTFAGNFEGTTQTLPLFVYLRLESGRPGGAIVLSLLLVVVSFAVLFAMRDRWSGGLRA